MSMSSILATYKAKDEAEFTKLGCSKDAGLKVITGFIMDLQHEKKMKRIERQDNMTPEKKAEIKAKREARRKELREAIKMLRSKVPQAKTAGKKK